jgi:hypothetical protein
MLYMHTSRATLLYRYMQMRMFRAGTPALPLRDFNDF